MLLDTLLIGYYAVGANITLTTIQPSRQGSKEMIINDLINADLSTTRGRIKNAVTMIRLVKIFRKLEITVKNNVDLDMRPLSR